MPVLNWLNRDEHLNIAERVPYRLLEEVPELGCGNPDTGSLLVQGINRIGKAMERASGGTCLFLMVFKKENGMDMRTQLKRKIGAAL